MGRKDPRVDAYIARAQPFARPILTQLRRVVHTACPDVDEGLKWSTPHFDYKGAFCGMAAFKAHCIFGFWKHKLLIDRGLIGERSPGMSMRGHIKSMDDLPGEKQLTKVIKAAAALNDEGIKVERAKLPKKPPPKVPAYLKKALASNKRAAATFMAFSSSHKREYVEWVTEARTDETRQRRLDTAVQWIAEGKARHWKYQPK